MSVHPGGLGAFDVTAKASPGTAKVRPSKGRTEREPITLRLDRVMAGLEVGCRSPSPGHTSLARRRGMD